MANYRLDQRSCYQEDYQENRQSQPTPPTYHGKVTITA